MRKKVYLSLIGIIILTFLAGSLVEPKYIKTVFPGFWDIPFKLGLDLQGGIHLLYEADLSNVEKEDYSSAMQGLRDIIERRVNLFGVSEPVVRVQEAADQYRLVVELAGIKDPAEAIEMIGQTPFLEFREQKAEEETQKILDKQKDVEGRDWEEIQEIDGWQLILEDPYFQPTPLTGQYLKRAELGFEQTIGTPFISLQFNDEGAKIFEELTSRNIGKLLAIYIDGMPISTPVVQETISGGQAQITGSFTIESARELVRNLNAGALPVPITIISQQSIGPTLGKISLEESLKAGLYGFLLVIFFLLIFYRVPGFLASLSLAIYIILILSLFKLIPVTLTLAGIGGFILSIGMAVDANILIFSRMREELKEEKSFSIALEEGFRRSWPSIRDGNVTTLIVALILFQFGTSFIQGFALTLSIGILLSMFSAIFITKNLMRLFATTRFEKYIWIWR
ncbi:MAG: protein translocase subunit SecD [Candidatus Nealsonbacteria bacterium]|nr:protein translocase subunit SecD [Candidatus Nealsonbacteria bacterium]